MFNSKYSNFLTVILVILVIAIVILIGYFAYDIYRKYYSNNSAEDAVDAFKEQYIKNEHNNISSKNEAYLNLIGQNNETVQNNNEINNEIISENPSENLNNNGNNNSEELNVNNNNNQNSSNKNNGANSNTGTSSNKNNNSSGTTTSTTNKSKYSGYTMIGTIEIPKIKLKSPILEEISPSALQKAICMIYGNINEEGNAVYIGHNNRNGTYFSNLKKLSNGDRITITDYNGEVVTYIVYDMFQTSPDDTSFYQRDTNGRREITLSTCTDNDDSKRIIVLAEES